MQTASKRKPKPPKPCFILRLSSVILISCVFCLLPFIAGCDKETIIDPNTGQAINVYKMSDSEVNNLDVAANMGITAAGIAGAVSVWWPPAAAIAGIIAGLIGMWAKMKPSLTLAQTKAQAAYNATQVLVGGIELLKEKAPEQWDKILKPELVQRFEEVGAIVENIVRAMRNLPEKPVS